MSVGVMKDYKLKLRNLRTSHTFQVVYIFVYYELLLIVKVVCKVRLGT
jgi:hypothetical protein